MGSWEVPDSSPNRDTKKRKKITYKQKVGADMGKKVWGCNQIFIQKYLVHGFVKR